VTAIRETFEEAGLLLAKSCMTSTTGGPATPQLDQDALNRARQSILLGKTGFSKFLDDAGLTPAVDELLPFTEWVTPAQVPRCGSHFVV
jgi:8-oxo-dGTP pyrophosphatase MutT (NUDIX family)